MTRRLKVGVVGAGLIAQVMHLNYLRELSDRYEIAALCDISAENAKNNAERYNIPKTFSDWRAMLQEPIDAVLILTSGSHAPIAIAAAKAGKHVLVEKPMCFSVEEGLEMQAAAQEAGTVLMVAYPKRYDPAYERFRNLAIDTVDPRLLRVTTFESPFLPYVQHYSLAPVSPIPAEAVALWKAQTQESITRAIGDADPFLRESYHAVLLDTLVHELNTIRGVFGEPTSLEYVDLMAGSLTVVLKFEDLTAAIHWLDLPGITRYEMEFAIYGPESRTTLSFPSPFLRSAPATVEIIDGEAGTAKSRSISETVSYESSFKLELQAFHDCVVEGTEPLTNAQDALHDLALCQSIIRYIEQGESIAYPSSIDAPAFVN
jgi:predicted dehydrogenase